MRRDSFKFALGALTAMLASNAGAQSHEHRWPIRDAASVFAAVPPAAPSEPVPTEPSAPEASAPASTQFSFLAGSIPAGTVGGSVEFDFRTMLTMEGDNPPPVSEVTWTLENLTGYSAAEGPTLSALGYLSWTPASAGTANFEVVATHPEASARQAYTIEIAGVTLSVVQVSVGFDSTCAVTSEGAAVCWGSNGLGQLGDNSLVNSAAPVQVQGLSSGVVSVAVGNGHACAMLSDGSVKCWGYNALGQLGNGATANSSVPVTALAGGAKHIVSGNFHVCAQVANDDIYCWGRNDRGQLGRGSIGTFMSVPGRISGAYSTKKLLGAGGSHTCALLDGYAYCWGLNYHGQLRDGTASDRGYPVKVYDIPRYATETIVGGESHSCAKLTDGSIKCWGDNSKLQLVNLPASYGMVSVAAGNYNTCGKLSDGRMQCWGDNTNGQIGNGTTGSMVTMMTDVPGLSSPPAVMEVGFTTCVITTDQQLMCWGRNTYGQVGDGTQVDKTTPTLIELSPAAP